ncbi:MFS general substrate transporter [Hypoxylon fragiforme]|uniref:MFS general substrate transporter n=1 Tax=Hypoxylon fragiforme TaxID=63214 RepID=UPI0020C62C42|nr:MFS general substrate transporter [Hypoxylon fragiforme]KAI2610788.1 MFS general substrate transporter [Hypoxylon fragiforme]
MASSIECGTSHEDHGGQHDYLERRLSTDNLLAHHDPVAPTGVPKPVARCERWLLYMAASSALLCMFTINFDLLFLSTNYGKRIASDLHQLSNAVWIILVGSITETSSQPVMVGDISGGPLGSAIADSSGWQSVFRTEALVMLCGLIAASYTLKSYQDETVDPEKPRLDPVQSLLLFAAIALPLFALNLGGVIVPWDHPAVVTLFVCIPFALGGLLLASARSSTASFIPRVRRNRSFILANFATTLFVVYAFNALTYNMAVYIEARSFDNPSKFGDWALSCIFLSRPFGASIAGLLIKRYRSPWTLLRCNMALYFLLYLLVATGLIPLENPATAPYLLLIGLSIGAFESCLIVSLFSAVLKKDQSSFLAIFNVVVAFAGDVGVGVSLALTKNFIRNGLYRELAGTPNYEEIISKALQSLDSIRNIPRTEQVKIIAVYIGSIEKVLAISCVTLVIGLVATIPKHVVVSQEEDEPERSEQEYTE